MRVIVTWHNAGPHTIWAKLAERLGREPTRQEAADEVRRILREAREAELDAKTMRRLDAIQKRTVRSARTRRL